MLMEYTQKALEGAEYKRLDDGTWFGEIPGFEGVWANGPTVESCRKELVEVLEESEGTRRVPRVWSSSLLPCKWQD